jgi:predicted flap endonuclease-1-like 5' DNA nuclease
MMFTSLFSFSLLSAEAAARGGIPWWVWVILILILLVILWYWFGREEEEPSEAEPQVEPVASKASTVAAEPAAEAPSQPVKPDDLKKIEGIGPKVSGLLNQAGIMTFQQMVDAGAEKLESILDQAGLQMLDADTWPEQAKLAAAGDWEGLKKLQDELKGGKRV